MKPFLSLCMIVKNEEKVLNRCLSSVANLVDEIIVVDTGSTDNTKKIASNYTSHIYDFEWIDDFSAARNFAASKASGEWILVLDADEYIDKKNFSQFIQEVKNDANLYNAYTAKIISFSGSFGENIIQHHHYRIYRNNGRISYFRHIHEQLTSNNGEQLNIKNSSLIIFHSGYLHGVVKEKGKSKRNKKLLDLTLENYDHNPFDYFNQGNEYMSIGQYEKALESYIKAYKQKGDLQLSWVSMALVQIINCLIQLQRYNDALNIIKDAEVMYNESPEILYLKGEVYLQRRQFDDAKRIFLQIVNNPQQYHHIICRLDVQDFLSNGRLAEIYFYEENYQQAIFHYISALNSNKYSVECIQKVIYILNKFHTIDEITTFLKSNQLVNRKNISSYVKTCFDVGNPTLAIELLKDYEDEHKLLYKVALLKQFNVIGIGNIEEFLEIFKPDIIKPLMESNWVNIIDILLLKDYLSIDNNLISIFNLLKKNEKINQLINLIEGKESIVRIDGNLIVYALKLFLLYEKYDLCNVILDEIEKTDKSTILNVARVLFTNGFKGEALQLYNLCELHAYDEQDFVNIINSLLDINNKAGAVEFAKYATIAFKNDYRFYAYILDNSNDSTLLKSTANTVQKIFN